MPDISGSSPASLAKAGETRGLPGAIAKLPFAARSDNPEVIRPAERRLLQSPVEGIDVYLLSADTARQMMPLEVHFAPGAIRAGELLRNRAVERLRAALAEWRFDALRTFRAVRAEMDAGLRRAPAGY